MSCPSPRSLRVASAFRARARAWLASASAAASVDRRVQPSADSFCRQRSALSVCGEIPQQLLELFLGHRTCGVALMELLSAAGDRRVQTSRRPLCRTPRRTAGRRSRRHRRDSDSASSRQPPHRGGEPPPARFTDPGQQHKTGHWQTAPRPATCRPGTASARRFGHTLGTGHRPVSARITQNMPISRTFLPVATTSELGTSPTSPVCATATRQTSILQGFCLERLAAQPPQSPSRSPKARGIRARKPRICGAFIGAPGFEPGTSPTRIVGEIRGRRKKCLQIDGFRCGLTSSQFLGFSDGFPGFRQ